MSILNKILDQKKEEIRILKNNFSLNSFESMELFNSENLNLIDNIKNTKDISIIAELKKKSPSKGVINKKFDYKNIIETYFNSKIACVSILTDEVFFGGNINMLKEIAKFKKLPLLRKDFITDVFQVYQSKAFGADVILLICEALSKAQINELICSANEIDLEVLLELHSENQINKIDFSLSSLVGINNRNLTDFSVDLNTTVAISQLLPEDVLIVSESGIRKNEDLSIIKRTNVNAVLVGDFLMSSNNLNKSLMDLMKWCQIES
ncbi:MAG: indole-3-glycerol phosphate synthase TrpC [Bacteroidetes bacterium]|nr:indole-3-glycerol phosphate synthase TrpC [Bacteroidota bacterium]